MRTILRFPHFRKGNSVVHQAHGNKPAEAARQLHAIQTFDHKLFNLPKYGNIPNQ